MRGVRSERLPLVELLRRGKWSMLDLSAEVGMSPSVIYGFFRERGDQIKRELIPRGKGRGSGGPSVVYWME